MGSDPLELLVVCTDELRGIDNEGARAMDAVLGGCELSDGTTAAARTGAGTLSSLSKKGLLASTVRGGCARACGET